MHLNCAQSTLSKSLGDVGHAIAPRGATPITGFVLIASDGDRLKLAGTNIDMAIVTWIEASIADAGSVAVPHRLFSDLVNAMPNDTVELDLVQRTQTLAVKGARFNANVKGVDASEFPAIDQVSDAPLVRVGADDLRQAIRDVEFAAAKDEGRPQLSGILLRARGHKLTLVGCDSYRLSLRTIELEAPATEDVDLIIPAKAMAEVARIQGALDEPIHIAVKPGRQILFHTSSVDIVSRLIDGAYVEFQRVIDQTSRHTVKATLATADLQRAARFTSFVSRDNNNALRIHVKPSGDDTGPGLVQLEATAKQVGENSTDLDAVVAGGAAEISLDNTYMTDALDAIHSQQLVLSATSGPSLPVLLHPVGTDGSLHIIMPMHLTQ